jgi:hypothetical protein
MTTEMNDLIRAAAFGARHAPAEERGRSQPPEPDDAGARERSGPSRPPDFNTVLRAAFDARRTGTPTVLLRGRPIV